MFEELLRLLAAATIAGGILGVTALVRDASTRMRARRFE